jgi:hypothetical protein
MSVEGAGLDGLDSLDGRELRLLVEIERPGSINRAAASCGIGQPAATRRLQQISIPSISRSCRPMKALRQR